MKKLLFVSAIAMLLAIAVLLGIPGFKGDPAALAAVQSAMTKVKSLHYTLESPDGLPSHEVWATPDTAKQVEARTRTWTIWKEQAQYSYMANYKTLFILHSWQNTDERFGALVDPREIARVRKDQITTQEVERDGKSMLQIEVENTPKVTSKADERRQALRHREINRIIEILNEQANRGLNNGRRMTVVEQQAKVRAKLVYLVDPSTNLVQSIDVYIPNQHDRGSTLMARIAKIDYNIDLPNDLFSTNTPPGTKVYDLRNGKSPEKDSAP